MSKNDHQYVGIPWKDGGRTPEGCDCVGLTCLFLEREFGFKAATPSSAHAGVSEDVLKNRSFTPPDLKRGDVIFFRNTKGLLRHVAVWLGDGKLLHVARGCDSRIENGFVLARRAGLDPVGSLSPADAEKLAAALADSSLGDPSIVVAVIGLVISIVLSVAASLLMPKLARLGNKYGRYGFDALFTQNSPEIPLSDLLGEVVVSGNSPYTQLSDKNLLSTPASQKANKVIILCSGPCEEVDFANFGVTINGLTFNDKFFHDSLGIFQDPAQTKAESVTGTILGDSNVPSVSSYDGAHAISVPVDVRAEYDRTFPVYGFSGCSYLVFRLVDSSKFSSFNLTARVKGRQCRAFDEDGFLVTTVTNEAVGTGDSATRRWKLDFDDLASVTSVTVNAVAWTAMDASHQNGNVYHVNRTKGYIEFPDNIPGAFAIVATYDYYTREWSQNPAMHLVYLLTEVQRGKGFDESKINWPAAVGFRDYCDESVTWSNSNGVTTSVRYTSNYSVDFRKPVQEHMQAVLDAANASLFLSGGKFLMKARASATSVFSFDATNILKGSFSSELVLRTERPNRLKLFYHSKTAYNAETEVVREDPVNQRARAARAGNEGIVEENLKFAAVDNQEQAERLGESILRESVNERWVCNLKTTILGLALEPGDVVDVTHSSQPSWSEKLFRVEAISHAEDDRLELLCSEYFAGAFM